MASSTSRIAVGLSRSSSGTSLCLSLAQSLKVAAPQVALQTTLLIERSGRKGSANTRFTRLWVSGGGDFSIVEMSTSVAGVDQYKKDFIEFMVSAEVLTFGDFVTKSGRDTPYFVNTGRYRTGPQIAKLAGYYADAIDASGVDFDVLFGPAYKGIPLCVATAMALHQRGRDVSYCFNRKEAKDHGEGGTFVGEKVTDGARVLIIEDVTTAGTSLRETIPQLQAAAKVNLAGLVVSVDRMERGQTEKSALSQAREDYKMPAFSIVTVEEVMAHLAGREINGRVPLTEAHLVKMRAYLATYGGA